ncbi:MAG: selenium-dependent xanthine dehydrogenase [Clostridiales bacterium]|nr:selenium-dependent xanthine dehydrogenase [Clostridiales bacterium]
MAFTVNGRIVDPQPQGLLGFLRGAGLTSVKDGCSEGACGTCMVLVDGKAQRACLLKTQNLEGKSVQTVEGLSLNEHMAYTAAFGEAGAVQCGFCIPGMIISAKGLLDQDPDPTRAQVKAAIRGNLCRCTGYKRIIDGVLLAARYLREGVEGLPESRAEGLPDGAPAGQSGAAGLAPARTDAAGPALAWTDTAGGGGMGEALHRVDGAAKVAGSALYADDLSFPGMLHGGAVRSMLFPRARVLSVDTAAAKALPGVAAVLTAEDIPGAKKAGHLKKDWDVLIPTGQITHCLGDPIALIAAESKEILARAREMVRVEYEELPFVASAAKGIAEGAPLVHEDGNLLSQEHLIRGDADEKIRNSRYVVTNRYSTPFTEHAFLEPETAAAMPDPDREGGIRIFSGDQGIYQTCHECADMLGLPQDKVRVTAMMVGGGFGGKEDMSVQHHAALLAWLTKKPVKVSLSRQESILTHPKRHAMEITMTTACDEQGMLTAMKAEILADTGAYASLGGPVLQRACTHAAGPYQYQDVDILGKAVYTNNPPAGAFRGFGVPQSCFATECNINQLAEMAGLSPWEMRFRNAIRPGQVLPNGQYADESTALAETLEAVKEAFDRNPKAGIACAMKNSGLGVGVKDVGRCDLAVEGGRVEIRSSAACIGQGLGTVLTQIVAQVTGLGAGCIYYAAPDTAYAPDAGNTTASRQTLFTGEAARRAAEALKKDLDARLEGAGGARSGAQSGGQVVVQKDAEAETAGDGETQEALAALEGRVYRGEYEGQTDAMGSDKPNPVSHIAYGYATQLVELDDEGKVARVIAAHDAGRVVNPLAISGQIEGGVVMSLGYALTEDYPLDNCRPAVKMGTLGLMRATDVPEVQAVLIEKNDPLGLALGAKGIGEICSIPTAPAVQLAYYQRDGVFRRKLPLEGTPYRPKKQS